ncbi:MAG TPA: glycosyltransferase family 39 protein [Candidatus Limiplasma sp.]|nr:glycosyltransferase family 39 protein [Candidatus Limiplasma sp.]
MRHRKITEKQAKRFTVLFFLLLMAVGLLTSADYGQPWDEPLEQDILRMNLNEYAAQLNLKIHLPLVSDIDNRPDSGLISDSDDQDHGESAFYPVFLLVCSNDVPSDTRMLLWHMYSWLWWMAGATALYCIVRRMQLSRLLSCTAVLFFALSPRLFAQGHYNNKDMVLLSALLIMLWMMLRLAEKPTVRRAVPYALISAVASNTKILGFFLFGACSLYVLIRLCAEKRFHKRTWIPLAATLVGYLVFWFLLTPAMWADLPGHLQYTFGTTVSYNRWFNYILFRGTVYGYEHASLPFYYLPYMIIVTTPLWLLGMIGTGQIFALYKLVRERRRIWQIPQAGLLLLCTMLWVLPIVFAMSFGVITYNGWRHFYFLFGPMLVLAAYGLQQVLAVLKQWKNGAFVSPAAALLALAMGATATGMAVNHPYQYTYYNALLYNKDISDYMELDYWNVSVVDTIRDLLQNTEGNVTIAGVDTWAQTGLQHAYDVLSQQQRDRITVLAENDPDAAYYLVNPTYVHFSGWTPEEGMELAAQTMSYGLPICEIYAAEDLK